MRGRESRGGEVGDIIMNSSCLKWTYAAVNLKGNTRGRQLASGLVQCPVVLAEYQASSHRRK